MSRLSPAVRPNPARVRATCRSEVTIIGNNESDRFSTTVRAVRSVLFSVRTVRGIQPARVTSVGRAPATRRLGVGPGRAGAVPGGPRPAPSCGASSARRAVREPSLARSAAASLPARRPGPAPARRAAGPAAGPSVAAPRPACPDDGPGDDGRRPRGPRLERRPRERRSPRGRPRRRGRRRTASRASSACWAAAPPARTPGARHPGQQEHRGQPDRQTPRCRTGRSMTSRWSSPGGRQRSRLSRCKERRVVQRHPAAVPLATRTARSGPTGSARSAGSASAAWNCACPGRPEGRLIRSGAVPNRMDRNTACRSCRPSAGRKRGRCGGHAMSRAAARSGNVRVIVACCSPAPSRRPHVARGQPERRGHPDTGDQQQPTTIRLTPAPATS